jgi:hypothetical protein
MYAPLLGDTSTVSDSWTTLPYWVELVRSGNTFSSYVSIDGVNWTQVGSSQTINIAQTLYVGLVVDSGTNSSLASATFDNVSVSASSNSAPVITSLRHDRHGRKPSGGYRFGLWSLTGGKSRNAQRNASRDRCRMLIHCPRRLGAAAAVLAAELPCADGVFTK